MGLHRIDQQQDLPITTETAWEFLVDPRNLQAITPDDLDFSIVSDLPEAMYDGLTIEYRIGLPLVGRQRWLTEIKHIRPGRSFVDEQRHGPYALWYHFHEVVPNGDGCRMIDQVHYRLPAGPIGDLVHTLWVGRMLRRIFAFRRQALIDRFGDES